jgi:hypothetical protein
VLKRVEQFGDAFELRVSDGKVQAKVEAKEKTA